MLCLNYDEFMQIASLKDGIRLVQELQMRLWGANFLLAISEQFNQQFKDARGRM